MQNIKSEADICIIAEGSYPYYSGGVAQWVHELITEHKEHTFHVLTLMPPHPDLTMRYNFPPNVVGHTVHVVQFLPKGLPEKRTPIETWHVIKTTIEGLISSPEFEDFGPLLTFCREYEHILGKKILTESPSAWRYLIDLYREMLPSGPFKDFFTALFILTRSLLSVSLLPLPPAKLYHALCTGYAGFLLYRAKVEQNAPCFITEQGIYTNERRIEIALADWISDIGSPNLAIQDRQRNLKDFWLNAFLSMSHVCYTCCDQVLTTYDGNQEVQLAGGADPKKMRVILHGINPDQYPNIIRDRKSGPFTVAFVGRIVPIKDIKTFIRACRIVKEQFPDTRFYLLGPTEEDPVYFEECKNLVTQFDMASSITFFGKVNLKDYLTTIDLLVLTSLSEAQPLVILEAGSSGIPFVATHVGACHQLCYGRADEKPSLGQGGIVTPLANPEETAQAIIRFMTDKDFYQKCSTHLQQRIRTYYRYDKEHEAYRSLYQQYIQ